MKNLLNTAVAGIVVVFVAFFGANAAHAAGCSNQTIHVDGELVYVSSKCTWNDAPASQAHLDLMTWGANLADTDNGPQADVVEATEEVVVGGGEASEVVVSNKLTKAERKELRQKIKALKIVRNNSKQDREDAKQARKDAKSIANKKERKAAKKAAKKDIRDSKKSIRDSKKSIREARKTLRNNK
jgi:hypothetical protein